MNHPDLGWTDPVGTLGRLQTAVRILSEGRGKTAKRMEKATSALVNLHPGHFPADIRNRATQVLSLRGKVAAHGSDFTHFKFYKLKPSERVRFIGDLLALYEACLLDIGRTWPRWDFMYPKDIETPPKTV